MALESSVFPVPSELVLIPAGILVQQGTLNVPLILLFSILGTMVGSFISYFVALHAGRRLVNHFVNKYGTFLLVKLEHLEKTEKYFTNHGKITIFLARLLPVVRHLISLPAGFARMSLWEFSLFTFLGAGLWSIVLLAIGYFIGANQTVIAGFINLPTIIVSVVAVIVLGCYIYLKKKSKKT
jgi:membrane protein DedA with SNARE-associated domain